MDFFVNQTIMCCFLKSINDYTEQERQNGRGFLEVFFTQAQAEQIAQVLQLETAPLFWARNADKVAVYYTAKKIRKIAAQEPSRIIVAFETCTCCGTEIVQEAANIITLLQTIDIEVITTSELKIFLSESIEYCC